MLAAAESGERRALARLISAIERGEAAPSIPLLKADDDDRLCVGITGAPGAGKSTLVSALTKELLTTEDSVAVLAVDPSSPISRGALLGDRVRMHQHATAQNVFIRSMATRAHHGGLAAATQSSRRLLQHCGWPLVLIETVGVGQVELDIVDTADLAVVVLNPGWGDEIQANKAGLMEIADVFVINKADRPGLESTRRDIDAVIINRPESERPAVIETVASEGLGIRDLADALLEMRQRLIQSGELVRRRRRQLKMELSQQSVRRFELALEDYVRSDALPEKIEALASGTVSMPEAVSKVLKDILSQGTNNG
ncbi:MAG: methylmalonyl Co-A mutase-associated GTPase MeaB [Congregibacter sp.]